MFPGCWEPSFPGSWELSVPPGAGSSVPPGAKNSILPGCLELSPPCDSSHGVGGARAGRVTWSRPPRSRGEGRGRPRVQSVGLPGPGTQGQRGESPDAGRARVQVSGGRGSRGPSVHRVPRFPFHFPAVGGRGMTASAGSGSRFSREPLRAGIPLRAGSPGLWAGGRQGNRKKPKKTLKFGKNII